ncbi:unnamed protein product [Lactuca saligna]|uniref:RRM domain-containing protein n=1 Tax=Lactuca saligna TaxID=75948 RepID=A0AA35Z6Q6_LACSI|nr:unnamed protein product [Lactuca saligna]
MLPRKADSREVENDGWTKVSRRKNSTAITSYYVTNLPQETTTQDLNELFKKFGGIEDIYIQGRKDKGGSYFGFVKFGGIYDAAALERSMQNLRLGPCILKESWESKRTLEWLNICEAVGVRSKAPQISSSTKRHVSLKPVPAMGAWSHCTLIVEVLDLQILTQIPKLIETDDNYTCKVFYAGGMKVALRFDIPIEAKSFLKDDNQWNRWFK